MNLTDIKNTCHLYLQGEGEMAKLTREFDWSQTALGSPESWSQSLLTTVSIILNSKFPMFLWWGDDLIQFYNDAYRPSLGNNGKHPGALGQRGEECWPEIWPVIKPLIDQVMCGGESTWREDQLIPIFRNNKLEDVYWTFSYSKVNDEYEKQGGVLVICSETTNKVNAIHQIEESYKEQHALNIQLIVTNAELSAANETLARINQELALSQEILRETVSELIESENRFRTLVRQAPVAIGVLKGSEYVIETANDKILEVWGKSHDIIGKPLEFALPELEGQPFLQLLNIVSTSGKPYYGKEVKAILIHNDEPKEFYFNVVYQPLQYQNESSNIIMVVAVDVTEQVLGRMSLEKATDMLRMSLNSSGIGSWNVDVLTDVILLSEEAQRIYGISADTILTFQEVVEMTLQCDRARIRMAINEALDKKSTFSEEYQIKRLNDDAVRWVKAIGKPYYDEQGTLLTFLGTIYDVTDTKNQDQRKDDFINIASHELRTPITSLKMSLQLLDRMKDNPSHEMFPRLIKQSRNSVQKISLLVEDLLDFGRLQEGKLELSKSCFTLFELISTCCNSITIEGKQQVIIFGDKKLQVYADEHRIDEVITNLVNNAIKYAPSSKNILLTIEKENDRAKVCVLDAGPGISPDKIPYLFDRYYQADNFKSKSSGLGLGLYISAEIIKSHGGEIGVKSELGKGSTFWFTLPLK
ncbi:MAG: hypothetical protein JWP45_3338 [Mucilaginibacter sp.]|nr:hypothetical protein [Mucilaginibacter sp.]